MAAAVADSTTEAALENQRLGGLQLRVAALCTLVQMCDGYDLNSVAWAVPSLIRDWQLPICNGRCLDWVRRQPIRGSRDGIRFGARVV